MKLTKRKAFKFFRSYYDVFNELSDKNKLQFISALLHKQFRNEEPKNLTGIARLAYISQLNNIESQIKGYQAITGHILEDAPSEPPMQPPNEPPMQQVKVKEEEQVKEKDKGKGAKQKRFAKPTLQELIDYFFEKVQSMEIAERESETFLDFYISKDWFIGKNKMKDWKAAVRNWIRKMKNEQNQEDAFYENLLRQENEKIFGQSQ